MKLFLSACCASLLLFACTKKAVTTAGDYTVAMNDCAEKSGADKARLCLTAVNDSRCPANVTCVWEGVGIANFRFTAGGTDHAIRLATKKFPNSASTDTIVGGYRLQLLDISPYPGSGSGTVNATVRIQ